MSYKDDIRKAVRMMSQSSDETISILCRVYAVDLTAMTCSCEPVNGGPDILNVNLMPVGNKKGFVLIPKVSTSDTSDDGFVMVTMTGPDDGFLSMVGEVDKVFLNSDNYGGLIKIDDLVDKLNNLENKVNSIITAYNSHTHPYVNVTTPATTSAGAPLVTGTLTPTTKVMLENPLVKHGSGI